MTSVRQIYAYQRARPKARSVAQRLPFCFGFGCVGEKFCQTKPFNPAAVTGIEAHDDASATTLPLKRKTGCGWAACHCSAILSKTAGAADRTWFHPPAFLSLQIS